MGNVEHSLGGHETDGMGTGEGVQAPCPERRGMAELDAERGVEEDGLLNAAPDRAPPPGEGGRQAEGRGKEADVGVLDASSLEINLTI